MLDNRFGVVGSLTRNQVVNYMNVASLALLAYDYLLTFGAEVDLVWPSRRSLGKILFFLNRYPPFIDIPFILYDSFQPNVPNKVCLGLHKFGAWMELIGICTAELILLLRTCALWGNNKKVAITLGVTSSLLALSGVTILAFGLNKLAFGPPPVPGLPGCWTEKANAIVFVNFILVMIFETIIVVLTMVSGVQHIRSTRSVLVDTLYSDGLIYYLYLISISTANVIVIITGPPQFVDLLPTLQRALHSMLCTRVLLHIRNISSGAECDLTTMGFTSHLTTLDFRDIQDEPTIVELDELR